MANAKFATSGLIAAKVTSADTDPKFDVGQRMIANDGSEYVYVQASGAIASAGQALTIDETFQAALLSTANDAGGEMVGIAAAALADNEYGWAQVKGVCDIQVAASAAADVALNTTGTAGQLDDDGTAGSFDVIGLKLTTARGGTAGTAAGLLTYPTLAFTANV